MNTILNNTINWFLNIFEKEQYSMISQNNIIGKFDNYNLITKDENFVTMFEIDGVSYGAKTDDEIIEYFKIRNDFFKSVSSLFSITIFKKRAKEKIYHNINIDNIYANNILNKWNDDNEYFNNRYYISIATRKKSFINFLEKQKENIVSSNNTKSVEYLNHKLNDLAKKILLSLSSYKIRRMSADENISFYASYCNMKETNIKPRTGLLSDSYISTNLFFEKDYIIHEDLEKIYSRFISIKTYDSDEIDSEMTDTLLNISNNIMICEHINKIRNDKALSILKQLILNTSKLATSSLDNLREEIKTDRETLFEYTVNILITSKNLSELDNLTKKVQNVVSKYNIISTVENINLKSTYFSFFPSRDNLNTRKRNQTSSCISVLNNFSQDQKGFNKNSYGDNYVTLFKTTADTPYKFNFHNSDEKKALGNMIIIAEAGSGKTSLASFLITCLMQYDINILAYDKLNGMYIFTKFLGEEYTELNNEFELNPFSLEDTKENRTFLNLFMKELANLTTDDFAEIQAIETAINMLYDNAEKEDILTYSEFLFVLEEVGEVKNKLINYKNSIFDNENCVCNFDNKLTVFGMDTILKDKKLSSMVSMYTSYKLKKQAQDKGKGFFVFYDELKDHLCNKKSAENILEQMLEGRKINGSTAVAVQNLDFFDLVDNKDSFLDQFAHYLIFPTSSTKSIEKLREQLNLTESEVVFLTTSDKTKFEVLLKNRKTNESIFLNVSLLKLNKYLKIYNSDSNEVLRLKELMKTNLTGWREDFFK